MHWQGLNIPEQVKWDEETLTSMYGKCTYAPFERGLARLVGNGLRRVLLSSLKGAAVTTVRIEGVLHEFFDHSRRVGRCRRNHFEYQKNWRSRWTQRIRER